MGFIKRIENFKKKSLCDLKLKTEKFENIHAQKKKKGKDKEKKKRKRKTDTRRCKGTKKKKENIRKKKKKKDIEACDIEVNHR